MVVFPRSAVPLALFRSGSLYVTTSRAPELKKMPVPLAEITLPAPGDVPPIKELLELLEMAKPKLLLPTGKTPAAFVPMSFPVLWSMARCLDRYRWSDRR